MIDLKTILQEGDPAAQEPPLSPIDIQQMRRNVLATPTAEARSWWSQPLSVGAAVTLGIAVAVGVGRQLPLRTGQATMGETMNDDTIANPATAGTAPRQLHFETPGGTRIIWVFDEEFQL